MTQWRRRRLWTSLGMAALVAPSGLALADLPVDGGATALVGQPAGEGGEGGEGGVDPARAAEDPVVWLIALDVIRAHYLAGLGAWRAGETLAGAEMFVHPIGEIYIDLEPVFEARGVPLFLEAMQRAGDLAFAEAPEDEVVAAVDEVLAAIDAAEAGAPSSTASPARVEAEVIAEMVDRAALQYRRAAAGDAGEAYLDGFGFFRAAQQRAARAEAAIAAVDAGAAEALRRSLATLAAAYPGARRPATLDSDPATLLAASSGLALAIGRL